ncbi:MAG TPA: ABC transporter ATP-binding protein [Mycobacteriales bacterium]|nr:ABC transporter ATP-binding protein [Mycobacteriales bacterium]HVW82214.1 ABC transporter ATP-binding protein [Mycobacteriales bacterium]
MIAVDGLRVEIAGKALVDEVSVAVGKEGWLALVGPNGAGKTTTLRALARLVAFTGSVLVDGQDTRGMRRRDLARLVAYVPQQPMFPADMTVADYALLGRTPHLGLLQAPSVADREICRGVLTRLGLGAYPDRTLATLSGGERQRLVLARALAQQAPLLLLDEPTSALDLGKRIDAMELVDELRVERALTVVTVVHDLTLAGQFADQLALLHHGRLVAVGSPSQVLRDEVLAEVYDADVRVVDDGGHLIVTSRRWGAMTRTVEDA